MRCKFWRKLVPGNVIHSSLYGWHQFEPNKIASRVFDVDRAVWLAWIWSLEPDKKSTFMPGLLGFGPRFFGPCISLSRSLNNKQKNLNVFFLKKKKLELIRMSFGETQTKMENKKQRKQREERKGSERRGWERPKGDRDQRHSITSHLSSCCFCPKQHTMGAFNKVLKKWKQSNGSNKKNCLKSYNTKKY